MADKSIPGEEKRIAQWRGVFDGLYRGSTQKFSTDFNIAGWQSIYSRDPLSKEVMAEWLDQTIERIRELAPRRLLEIGCGTGMILQRIAPHCERYLGTDLSAESIAFLRAHGLESGNVSLEARAADDLSGITGLDRGAFDTVVINSVVQYFPSSEYLVRVLTTVEQLMNGTGTVFLGDIRHLGLHAPLQAEVALLHADDETRTDALLLAVRKKLAHEREVLLGPQFFSQLKAVIPSLKDVETRLKTSAVANELTKYRYDVTLRFRSNEAARDGEAPSPVLECRVDDVDAILARDRPPRVRIANVANTVARGPIASLRLLADDFSVREVRKKLREELEERRAEGERAPHEWVLWAARQGYRAKLVWVNDAEDARFDVVLDRADVAPSTWHGAEAVPGLDLSAFASHPLRPA